MSMGAGYPAAPATTGAEPPSLPPKQQMQSPGMANSLHQQQQQQHQQQRLLYQQRIKQQQQQQLHFEQQIYQLLTTLNRKPKRLYQFKEDPDDLLKKYEQFKPSFEFHIYENNFKICAPANSRLQQHQKILQASNDGLILNKNNEVLGEFLEYVARGIIPEAIMEVLKDCNIQFYEGCLILQVYDHTNTIDVKQEIPNTNATARSSSQIDDSKKQKSPMAVPVNHPGVPAGGKMENSGTSTTVESVKTENKTESVNGRISNTSDPTAPSNSSASPNKDPKNNSPGAAMNGPKDKDGTGKSYTTFKRPRMYRTLLRPNELTHYYDMLSYADHTRFPDSMYQQLESEILTLTKRNLNLDTPMNPYSHREFVSDEEFLQPTLNEEEEKVVFPQRKLCSEPHTKGAVDHIELHEELPQHSSTYEQLMLILSENTTTTTAATLAAAMLKKAEATSSLKASANGKSSGSTVGVSSNSVAAAATVGAGANSDTQRFNRLKIIEHWRVEKERRRHQNSNSNIVPSAYNTRISMGNPSLNKRVSQQQNDNQSNNQAQSSPANKRAAADGEEKPKAKRGRKATKKAADGTAAPPKKRAMTKKKAAAAAAANATSLGGT